MTLDELLKNWTDESNAANDIICEILDDYIQFIRIVRLHALTIKNNTLIESCDIRLAEWRPVLDFTQKHKEKTSQLE